MELFWFNKHNKVTFAVLGYKPTNVHNIDIKVGFWWEVQGGVHLPWDDFTPPPRIFPLPPNTSALANISVYCLMLFLITRQVDTFI